MYFPRFLISSFILARAAFGLDIDPPKPLELEEDFTLHGEMVLDRPIHVPVGRKLTIEAGTIIKVAEFEGPAFLVEGTLIALGRADAMIRLMVSEKRDYFRGIHFRGKAAGGHLSHVELQNGLPFAIRCEGASPKIEYCLFRSAIYGEGGILCANGAAPRIYYSKFLHSGRDVRRPAILCLDASPTIEGCTFDGYLLGVQVGPNGTGVPQVADCRLNDGALALFDERAQAPEIETTPPTHDPDDVSEEGRTDSLLRFREIFAYGEESGLHRMDFIQSLLVTREGTAPRLTARTYSGDFHFRPTQAGFKPDGVDRNSLADYASVKHLHSKTLNLGKSTFRILFLDSALSDVGLDGCADTPEGYVVLFDPDGRKAVRWISRKFRHGHFALLAEDLDGDGMDELIVGNSGWCDHFGRVQIYEWEGTREYRGMNSSRVQPQSKASDSPESDIGF